MYGYFYNKNTFKRNLLMKTWVETSRIFNINKLIQFIIFKLIIISFPKEFKLRNCLNNVSV